MKTQGHVRRGEDPAIGDYSCGGKGSSNSDRSGATPKVGQGTAKTFTYTVEVEDGIAPSSFGGDEGYARMVTEGLNTRPVNLPGSASNPLLFFGRTPFRSPPVQIVMMT
jgi:hypothetical protein